jgi:hypothetical protein
MTTDGISTPRARGRWPLGLVGMLAILAAAERYIEGRHVEFGTMTTEEWRLTSKAVSREAKKADILCFGTSLSRLGISPLVLQERTGLSAYNFALSGAQPYATALMLRHALAAGARPKAIVVDFKWTTVSNDPIGLIFMLQEIASLGEIARYSLDLRDGSFLGRVSLSKLLPSYAYRLAIRDNVAAALVGKEPARNAGYYTMVRNMRVNKGASHTPRTGFDGAVESKDVAAFFPMKWEPNAVNDRYVHEFLALAESLKVPVFVVIPPISSATKAKLDEFGTTRDYSAYIGRVLADHPGVTVLDGRLSGYPTDAFYDTSHLNRYGTSELSMAVGDAIKARLDGARGDDRLARLPAYGGGRGGDRIEDTWGSHEHVLEMMKVRDQVAGRDDSGSTRR